MALSIVLIEYIDRIHLNAVSTSIMGIVSTLSDAGQTEQPIAGAIPCFEAN